LICISEKLGSVKLNIEIEHLQNGCLHFLAQPLSFLEVASFLQQLAFTLDCSLLQHAEEPQAKDIAGIKKKPKRSSNM